MEKEVLLATASWLFCDQRGGYDGSGGGGGGGCGVGVGAE